ncbi:MAG: cytochrome c-type biogenesis protein CcmH [Bryobacteraceae bacterium]|nr:cytochrome c-type biogenesis protein CcmH [Bryobacteraceae bacterium]
MHRSEDAARMRAEVRSMVEQGKSEQEILDRFVSQYGERVLMEPRGRRRMWLNVMPWAALGAGGAFLVAYLARQREREG